jgi:hypothetical protein
MGAGAEERVGDGQARIVDVWLENELGARLSNIPQHQPVTLKARVSFTVKVNDPSASLYIYNEGHHAVVIATTWMDNDRTGDFDAGEEVEIAFTFDNVLAPGRYTPVFQLAHRGSGLDMIDRFGGGFSFVVTGPKALGGVVDIPVRSAISRVGASFGERTRA